VGPVGGEKGKIPKTKKPVHKRLIQAVILDTIELNKFMIPAVKSGRGTDKDKAIDTPTLIEVWRTAPYYTRWECTKHR